MTMSFRKFLFSVLSASLFLTNIASAFPIASLTQEMKPDRRFLDPRLGAVPTLRIADEEALSVKVQQLAKIVGTERFCVGMIKGLLFSKGVSLKGEQCALFNMGIGRFKFDFDKLME
jgi:hypothetical protein